MKSSILLLLLLTLLLTPSLSQQPIVIGLSPSYISQTEDGFWQHEFNLNLDISFPLWKGLELGSRYMAIRYTSIISSRRWNAGYMVGPIVRWRETIGRKASVQLEGGYMFSNYCLCGFGDPYRVDRKSYWHLAGVMSFKTPKEGWWLDVGLFIQPPLPDQIDIDFAHNIPVVGLSYHFPSRALIPSSQSK